MATLHLIRHGQASFGSENYDQLSQTGWRQGRVTGRFLNKTLVPGMTFMGELQRHRETADAIAEAFAGAFPKPHIDGAFDEFDHLEVIQRHRPSWADPQQMQAELAREQAPRKAFQKTFAAAVNRWVSGKHDHEYRETWAQFSARVWGGVENAVAKSEGAGDLVIVTSGGPVSVVVQKLLGLSDSQALGLNAVLANAGVTRMLFSGSGDSSRKSLAAFNSIAHLEMESPDLVTYR